MAATGVMTGGVLVRVAPPDGTFPQLYEEHWEPVWAAAAEVGYPVTTHGGNAPIYAPGSGRSAAGADHLDRTPRQTFRDQVRFGASFPSAGEIASLGEDAVHHIMWGNDYPHNEGTWPHSMEALRVAFAGRDAADVAQMVSTNAADLYGFDLDALAPLASEVGPRMEEVVLVVITGFGVPFHEDNAISGVLFPDPQRGERLIGQLDWSEAVDRRLQSFVGEVWAGRGSELHEEVEYPAPTAYWGKPVGLVFGKLLGGDRLDSRSALEGVYAVFRPLVDVIAGVWRAECVSLEIAGVARASQAIGERGEFRIEQLDVEAVLDELFHPEDVVAIDEDGVDVGVPVDLRKRPPHRRPGLGVAGWPCPTRPRTPPAPGRWRFPDIPRERWSGPDPRR